MTIIEPSNGRNRARYQAAIDDVTAQHAEFAKLNPYWGERSYIRVTWKGRHYVVAGAYRDANTGGSVPFATAFA